MANAQAERMRRLVSAVNTSVGALPSALTTAASSAAVITALNGIATALRLIP